MKKIVPTDTCDECGMKVEPGLLNWAKHYHEHHIEKIRWRSNDRITIEDIEKVFEKWDKLPTPKPQIVLHKWWMEAIPDKSFVNTMLAIGESYTVTSGKEAYDYFVERYERLGGKL